VNNLIRTLELHSNRNRDHGDSYMSWFIHWDPSFDLARGGVELNFRKAEDMTYLLVETEAIRHVDNLIKK
jgi:hypothetical protein